MIRINSGPTFSKLIARVTALADQDKLLRRLATNTRAAMKIRIHVDGNDSSGTQIGVYSPAYMKVRTGNYGNATRVKRGIDKGKNKDAGFFERRGVSTPFGKSKIAFINISDQKISRPQYNRSADTKVVASLTRQMVKDMSVVETARGYGVGYNNPKNADKVGYLEDHYQKKIFKRTQQEIDLAKETIKNFIAETKNG